MFKKLSFFQRISNKIDPEFWFRLQGSKQTAHFQESGHTAGIVIRTRLITLHIIMGADNDPFSCFRAKGADYVLVLFAVLSEPLYPGAPAGFPEFLKDIFGAFIERSDIFGIAGAER